MNEVMWREVMDSCNRDAPCRLDLTLAMPLMAQGCLPCSPLALRSSQFRASVSGCDGKSWVVPIEEGEHCLNPKSVQTTLPDSSARWACRKPGMENLW